MSACASCGSDTTHNTTGSPDLCSHHTYTDRDDWAVGNKAICDGLHRGKWPKKRIEIGLEHEQQSYPQAPADPNVSNFWD